SNSRIILAVIRLLSFGSYFHLLFPHFFFSIKRRHPIATLFPTRRSSDLPRPRRRLCITACSAWNRARLRSNRGVGRSGCWRVSRSEEHTSELQSRENLVCRLLLEKKKNITHISDKKLRK